MTKKSIYVKPGSSKNEVGGDHDGALVVRVQARALDGKANDAVISVLAKHYGVRKREVVIVSGMQSRKKIVEITGIEFDVET